MSEETEDLDQLADHISRLLNEFMIAEYAYELRDEDGEVILQVERFKDNKA